MPPTFILILAGVIVLTLGLVAVDLATRRRRRRKVEADQEAQYAAEQEPVPGLAQVAGSEGWHGPVADPMLTPGLPFGGVLPEGHLLAGRLPADQLRAAPQPVNPALYAGNLTARLHSALSPDKRIRGAFRDFDVENVTTGPTYLPGRAPRLVHCYSAAEGGVQIVVGNCFLTLAGNNLGSTYGGPIPDWGYIGSAFCATSLASAVLGYLQVFPRERSLFHGAKSGFPELDARYGTLASFGAGSRSKTVQRARQLVPKQPDPLGPGLAAFIAGRDDWAFTVDRGLLVCATLEPLRDGEQARQLVADTRRAAQLVGT